MVIKPTKIVEGGTPLASAVAATTAAQEDEEQGALDSPIGGGQFIVDGAASNVMPEIEAAASDAGPSLASSFKDMMKKEKKV